MRFFTFIATTASLLATFVSAQNALAISAPAPGAILQAGTTTTITWVADTDAEVVLTLRFGQASDLAPGTPIGTVTNAGTADWTIPTDLADGDSYTIEIADGSGGANVNYSPFFTITGGTGAAAQSSATTAASSVVSSAASSATSAKSSAAASSTDNPPTLTKSKTTATPTSKTSTAVSASASAPSNDAMSMRSGSLAAVVGMGALVMLA